jgi:lysophospholipase L1-like esterase
MNESVEQNHSWPKHHENKRSLGVKIATIGMVATLISLFVCILLVSAEFLLRVYYRNVLSSPSGYSYFYNKNYSLFKKEMNALKMREKNFIPTGIKKYRVLVLGDSLTWGQGVYPMEKRFTEQTEHLFNQTAPNKEQQIDVLNTGQCGLDLPGYLKILPFINTIDKNFVLYQWFVNDMDIGRNIKEFKTPRLIPNAKIHRYLFGHSVLYFLLQRGYRILRQKTGKQKSYVKYLQDKLKDPNGKAARKARKLLNRLIDNFEQRGTPVGIVLFPGFWGPMDDYPLDFLHEQVLDVCKARHLDCLDLRETYRGVNFKKLWANPLDPHPGELAHKMAAEAIYAHYGPFWRGMIDRHQ